MMIKSDLVKKVKDYFALNIYETKVWLALLSKGVVSAGEAAELSGVPRSRTYDVLESLEKRGFAIVKLGKPVKYIAVEPNTVIDKMKNQTMSDANDRVKTLAELKETQEYMEIEQLHKSGLAPIKSEEISGFIKGKANISSKIREMFENSRKEFSVYTSTIDFDKKSRILLPLVAEAQKRNMKFKIALSGDDEEIKRTSSKHAIKCKTSSHKGRFYVSDKSEIVFMINSESAEEEMAIWLKAPFFTESVDMMVDNHIKK